MRALANMPVSRIMSEPLLIDANATATQLVGFLKNQNAYGSFVVIGSRIGVVTLQELLAVTHPETTKCQSLMIHPPLLSPDTKVVEAVALMRLHKLRLIPVVKGNEIIGSITVEGIASKFSSASGLNRFYAKNIMSVKPITVNDTDSAAKARKFMINKKIDHLPVLDMQMKLAGLLSSSHLVFSLLVPKESQERGAMGSDKQRLLRSEVRGLMDREPIVVSLEENAENLVKRMISEEKTAVLVSLWDEVQGIITQKDIANLLLQFREEKPLPLYIIGLPDDPFEAELARSKATRMVSDLTAIYSYIEEIAIRVKAQRSLGKRRLYEVDVRVSTPRQLYTFGETGWDLPSVFDELHDRVMRKLKTQKKKDKGKPAERIVRYMEV